MSRFLGQNSGNMKLDVVTQVSAVLSHRWFVQMIKPYVPVEFLGPGLSGTLDLSNVGFPILAGDAVYAHWFQADVILDRPKETGDLPRWEVYSFDVMSQ